MVIVATEAVEIDVQVTLGKANVDKLEANEEETR